MSILGRRVSPKTVAALAAVLIVLGLLPVMTMSPAREITLVAKDMAFYLEGDPSHPNPPIEVTAGERVRIVFRNADQGITHDFFVPAVQASSGLVAWRAEGSVTFRRPDRAGEYTYACRPHQMMMKGILRVRP